PRPMGKIYQPEVAAEAIVFAAEHDRREIYVGYPTVQAIVGDKIAPELGDYVMAKNGFKGQQTDEPEDPNRRNNLWEPVPGDHGAHGSFDKESTYNSPQLWLTMNRNKLIGGALALGGLILGGILAQKQLLVGQE
ncbi:MAG: short-chain dehydrogenase, partial [Hymenobacteraceae bacterium]|nr:short-chain dehydrogenase [Hymenobacteraceae bacterium]